jgi:hypothetical protein
VPALNPEQQRRIVTYSRTWQVEVRGNENDWAADEPFRRHDNGKAYSLEDHVITKIDEGKTLTDVSEIASITRVPVNEAEAE